MADPSSTPPWSTPPPPSAAPPDPAPAAAPHGGYLAELASHCALQSAAAEIGAVIGTHLHPGATVWLLDDPDPAATSWTDTQFTCAIELLERRLAAAHTALAALGGDLVGPAGRRDGGHDMQPAAVPATGSVTAAALGAVSDVLAGLTAQATVTARPVTTTHDTVTGSLGHALAHHPHVQAIYIEQFGLITADNPVLARLAVLRRAGEQLADLHAHAQRLLTQLETFLHEITTGGAGEPNAALIAARTASRPTPTHLLYTQINSTGADVITRKWLWHNTITFLGGAALSYRLLDTRTGDTRCGTQSATATFCYHPWRNRISTLTSTLIPGPEPGA